MYIYIYIYLFIYIYIYIHSHKYETNYYVCNKLEKCNVSIMFLKLEVFNYNAIYILLNLLATKRTTYTAGLISSIRLTTLHMEFAYLIIMKYL